MRPRAGRAGTLACRLEGGYSEFMGKGSLRWGVFGAVALLGASAAVHCKKATVCRATLTYLGKGATAEGPDKQHALVQACTSHCIEHDALVDGKYRVWRAAGGKGAGKRPEAIQSVPALRRYLDACSARCVKEARDVRYVDCADP